MICMTIDSRKSQVNILILTPSTLPPTSPLILINNPTNVSLLLILGPLLVEPSHWHVYPTLGSTRPRWPRAFPTESVFLANVCHLGVVSVRVCVWWPLLI